MNRPPEELVSSAFRMISGWLGTVILLALLGAGEVRASATDRKALPGSVPAAAGQLAALGQLPGTNQIYLAIGLPLHNGDALDELFRQIYDPQSTDYHKYLTPAEFTARFGPTKQDYQAVVDFAISNGLTVAGRHANRLVLDVQGSVAGVERAFQTTLRTYRHPTEPRNFFAPDIAPSVPATVPVNDLWGMTDYQRPHPLVLAADLAKASPQNYNGSGPSGTYQGADFRHAYVSGSGLGGSGETAAVAEFDGYYASDITKYEAQIGYTNVPLQNVIVDSVSGTPGYSGDANAVIEVSLDIEMIISMAPALSSLRVYEGSSPYDVFNKIVTDDVAKQISCSWTWGYGPTINWKSGRSGRGSTLDSQLEEMGVQGQSFFQAAGDSDAYTGSQALSSSAGPIPVDSIYVTSVGGTSLTMNGSGAGWSSETVWNWGGDVGSGGGISPNYTIPSWQANVSLAGSGGSTTRRNVPDVALTADAVTVDYGNGAVVTVGGTSCAAPLWAGFCALANEQAAAFGNGTNTLGFLNPALYAAAGSAGYASCFHDINTGNNIGTNTAGLFYATNGYDLCTGLGTPNGTNLINFLAPPPQAYFIAQPAPQLATNGGRVTLSVAVIGQAPLAYQWLFNGAPLTATNVAAGASASLTLTNCTPANSGNYSVVVTNNYSAITSSVAMVTVFLRPVITAPPASQIIWAGSNALFSVTASGLDLSYLWFLNGTRLNNGVSVAGATSSQLTLSAVNTNSGGNITVVVTNFAGSVTSSVAILTVVQPPVIIVPLDGQTIECGSNALFSATAIGTPPPAYQWSEDGIAIAAATNASLSLSNIHLPDHVVSVVLTNLYGSATDAVFVIVQDTKPPVITLNGLNPFYVELGSTFTDPGATAFDACAGVVPVLVTGVVNTNALGTNQLAYQASDGNGNSSQAIRLVIVRDTTPPAVIFSFTNLVLAAGADCAAAMPDVTGTNFIVAADLSGPPVITQTPIANAVLPVGTNFVILKATDTSGNAAYSTNAIVVQDELAPVILDEPASETNNFGSSVDFVLTATACTPLSYQWFFNGTVLADQTNGTLALANIGVTNSGSYIAVATATGGSVTSSVAILAIVTPPQILWSFTNLTLAAGPNCEAVMPDVTGTNDVEAAVWSGTPQIIQSPATNTALPIGTNVVVITVSDTYGNLAYSTNTIIVQDETPPIIANEPADITNNLGSSVTFALTVTACTPLSYQWFFNGTALADQTNGTLTLANIGMTNGGSYTAVATATGGSVTSSVAMLEIVTPPQILWSFTNLTLAAGLNCEAVMPDVTDTNDIEAAVWSGTPLITQSPATNTALPVGTNVVVITVSDTYGNLAYSTNTIIVQDETPPIIANEPADITNNLGSSVTFALTATACAPLSYQWFFNGTALTDQTNGTLALANIGVTNGGSYTAVATATGGSVTSSVAMLAIVTPPQILWSFTNLTLAAGLNCDAVMPDVTGTNDVEAAVWSGTPLITQSPATNTALPVGTNVVVITVSDTYGNTAYSTNTIIVQDETPPIIANEPADMTNNIGSSVTFALTATACTSLSYQWFFGDNVLAGQTNSTLTLNGISLADGGSYLAVVSADGGAITSSVALLDIITPPVVLWSFTNLVLAAGTNCEAAIPEVTDTNYIQVAVWSGVPVIVQSPATNAPLAIGTNTVLLSVSDAYGNTVYSTNTIVVQDETPPVIVSEPESATNSSGGTANFALTATACTPLAYQWFFNDDSLSGRTNAMLTLTNVGAANIGSYFAVATAAGGSTTSSVVVLNVSAPLFVPPLVLTAPGYSAGGFVLTAVGPASGSCILEMTTNLFPSSGWQPIFTNPFSAGTAQFVDPSATNDAQRFYRVLLGP